MFYDLEKQQGSTFFGETFSSYWLGFLRIGFSAQSTVLLRVVIRVK